MSAETVKTDRKIEFSRFTASDIDRYARHFPDGFERGCEFSFANLFLWGRQRFAEIDGQIVLFSQFDRRSVYPFPVGDGDKRAALDAIIADAEERDIPCRITGLSSAARELIESLYPGRFRFHCDEDSFDYVYDINDLADLKGRKYQSKRNHINRFADAFPSYDVKPVSKENIPYIRALVEDWCRAKIESDPNADFHMEMAALDRALRYREELEIEGLVILDGDRALAFTLGSRMTNDTVDVHFEKARAEIQGAYAAINCEFAKYIRAKYPEVRFLDREEDVGSESLRKAKQSYHPHHMIEKCWACLLEDGYDY